MNILDTLISAISVENILHVGSSIYPIIGAFLIAALGYILGAVKIKGISLGTAGVFLVAIAFGCIFLIKGLGNVDGLKYFYIGNSGTSTYKFIQNMGLVLFVTAVGFVAGPKFFRDLKRNAKSYVTLGIVITLSGLIVAVLFALIPGIGSDFSAGILSGALTSTPGFSAASEAAVSKNLDTTMVSLGHAIAYPFGVVGVVLFVQIIPKILKVDKQKELALMHTQFDKKTKKSKKQQLKTNSSALDSQDVQLQSEGEILGESNYDSEDSGNEPLQNEPQTEEQSFEHPRHKKIKKYFEIDPLGFALFAIAILLGVFVGSISIPISSKGYQGATFSLGNTGGPLLVALILGHFGHIGKLSLKVPDKTLKEFRELGLMLFLIGAGVDGGASLVSKISSGNFDGMVVLYGFMAGILMTIVPMVVGFVFAKHVLKLPLFNNLGSVTGGMTSTPALGALVASSGTEDVANAYAATYPIALILVVLGCNLMVSLI